MIHKPQNPVRDNILENTLSAVRQKKNQRKKNKTTLILAGVLVVTSMIVFTWQKNPESQQHSAQKTTFPLNDEPVAIPISSGEVQIDISEDGSIQTKSITIEELAKIVYNPSLEFTRTNDAFTWKGAHTVIHMSLPQTSMAITDTRDESL